MAADAMGLSSHIEWLSFANWGDLYSTRALQSSPFQISGGYPERERDLKNVEIGYVTFY